MSRDVMDAPLTPLEGAPVSNQLSAEYAMAPAAPFAGRNDSSQTVLPQVDMYDSAKDETAQPRELGPKFKPNAIPNSETAPDRPRDSETAPDRPRDSETAPDYPSDEINARVTLGPDGTIRRTLKPGETPIEGNAREMGSEAMKQFEKYRQWLKAHPPNIKLL